MISFLTLRRAGRLPFRVLRSSGCLISFVLALFCLGLRATPATAQDTLSVKIGTATAGPGRDVSVPITVPDLTGRNVTSYGFTLAYDDGLLDVQGASLEGTLSGAAGMTPVVNATTPGLVTVVAAGVSTLEGSGILVRVRFTTRNIEGTSVLEFSNLQFNEGLPATRGVNGQITVAVADVALGDVNADGQLDDADATRLLRHVTGREPMDQAQLDQADVSGDGGITAWDAVLIRRRAAGRIACFYAEPGCSEMPPVHGGLATVGVRAGEYRIDPETAFTVALSVDTLAATQTASYVLTLAYDADRLSFTGLQTDETLSEGAVVDAVADADTLTVAVATLDPIEGGGDLLHLQFESLPGVGVSDLALSGVFFNDDGPSAEPVDGGVIVRLLGDTSVNGRVSALDASLILQHVAGLVELEEVARAAAEVTGDGTVSALDATEVLRRVIGLTECLPAEIGCTELE